jgi:hypothetical protein
MNKTTINKYLMLRCASSFGIRYYTRLESASSFPLICCFQFWFLFFHEIKKLGFECNSAKGKWVFNLLVCLFFFIFSLILHWFNNFLKNVLFLSLYPLYSQIISDMFILRFWGQKVMVYKKKLLMWYMVSNIH